MPSISSIVARLKRDFPHITFIKGDVFRWSPTECAVYYENSHDTTSLLHEVAHAALKHTSYAYDIELLKMERQAWEFALSSLSKKYSVSIDREYVESMMDSYRDWLHDRSLCPSCQATGVQTRNNEYSCLACQSTWRVNEARLNALRRYKNK
jgi:hypothetical protein